MATAGGGAYGYPLGRPPGTGSAAVAIPSRRGAAPASDAAGLAVNAAGLAVDATVAGGSPLGTPPFVRLCGATLDGLRGLDDGGGGRAGGDGRLECFSVVSVSDGDLSSVGSSPPCVSSSLDTASLGFPPSLLSSGLFAAPWTSGGSVFEVAGTRTDALCEGAHGTAPPPPPLTGFVRRGAMDIGTSSHKLLVADVHTPSGTVLPVAVYEVRVPLGASLLAAAERERNGGGSGGRTEGGGPDSRSLLPPDALAASAAAVSTLAAAAATAGVPPGATGGVATAAFRRSANGAAHLAAVGARHALRLMVVDAAAEGELALLTVAASLGLSGPALGNGLGGAGGLPPGLVVWDSGGGSFQLARPLRWVEWRLPCGRPPRTCRGGGAAGGGGGESLPPMALRQGAPARPRSGRCPRRRRCRRPKWSVSSSGWRCSWLLCVPWEWIACATCAPRGYAGGWRCGHRFGGRQWRR